jgi:hypothetical protein
MLGCDDHGFVDINAMALNAAISGSIWAEPEACFVISLWLHAGVGHSPGHQSLTTVPQAVVGGTISCIPASIPGSLGNVAIV